MWIVIEFQITESICCFLVSNSLHTINRTKMFRLLLLLFAIFVLRMRNCIWNPPLLIQNKNKMDSTKAAFAQFKEVSDNPDQKVDIKQRIKEVKEQIVIYKEKGLENMLKLESLKKLWVYPFFFIYFYEKEKYRRWIFTVLPNKLPSLMITKSSSRNLQNGLDIWPRSAMK